MVESMKEALLNRYWTQFVSKLTPQDLEDLQFYLQHEIDENRQIHEEYRQKFREKLREYFHDQVLDREIVSIETLVKDLTPEDLEKS